MNHALERQQLYGGRVGSNLVALGYISEERLAGFLRRHPLVPRTLEETGLSLLFLGDLILKHVLTLEEFTIPMLVDRVKLPGVFLDEAVEALRKRTMVEVRGGDSYARASRRFALTESGRRTGSALVDLCSYIGPAPVTLEAYNRMVELQSVKHVAIAEESLKKAFGHLVIDDKMIDRLGPAISSGKAIFLYGPPGNGKTAIAEAVARILPEAVYLPYAIMVADQVITVFDPVTHTPVPPEQDVDELDQRWLLVKRPVVMAAGELSLKMLDLNLNPLTGYYEAPLQMKANNGVFIVDDFGRQMVEPRLLLNWWIVPLERRKDFLGLHTGIKFEVPFDQLVIFSTNIEPRELVDEAFLRRISYKIRIEPPTQAEFEAIFRRVCAAAGIAFSPEAFGVLIREVYRDHGVRFSACHPRDLVDHILDAAHFYNRAAEFSEETIREAWASYFVDMREPPPAKAPAPDMGP